MQDIYTITTIISIFSFTFVMVITPGPNNILLLSSGLNYGYKKTIPAIFGVMLGFPFMVILIGFGLGFIFEKYPLVLYIMKIIGIFYLFYIAYKIANTKTNIENDTNNTPFTLIQIVLFQYLNPKAWIMAITSISLFVNSSNNTYIQVFIISFIYMIVGIISTNTWTLGGVYLQRFLKNEKQIKLFNYTMASLMIVSILTVIF